MAGTIHHAASEDGSVTLHSFPMEEKERPLPFKPLPPTPSPLPTSPPASPPPLVSPLPPSPFLPRSRISSSASSPELASLSLPSPPHTQPSPPLPTPPHPHHPTSWSSLSTFISAELFSIDSSGSSSHPSSSPRALVYNFLILPYFLERLLSVGFFICLDCFLYLFTILPLRVLLFTLSLITRTLTFPFRRLPSSFTSSSSPPFLSAQLSSQLPELLRFFLLLLSWYWLSMIPMSRIYHYIRGQSVLKLYVIFNMLQISDRLFASIGEDILDALFSSIHSHLPTAVFHLSISSAYVFLHSLLLFAQVITLNVSVNSDNSSLFIVLVSNNFVELKGAVFKRFDAHNLFQISCSDVVERFQLVVFLVVIVVMNVSHLGVSVAVELSWVEKAVTMCLMVLLGECFVDWVKVRATQSTSPSHAPMSLLYSAPHSLCACVCGVSQHGFICKFNMISPRVYRQFAEIVNNDFIQAHLAGSARSRGAHSVSRRLGLSSLPLAVLVLRVFGQALMSMRTTALSSLLTPSSLLALASYVLTAEGALKGLILLLGLCVLTALKLLLTITLVGRISVQALHDKQTQAEDDACTSDRTTEKEKERGELHVPAETNHAKLETAEALLRVPAKREDSASQGALRVKKEDGESDSARRGRLADALTIDTSQLPSRTRHIAAVDAPMPPLEAPCAPAQSPQTPLSSSLTVALSETSSLSASPCISPSSSSALYPVQHEGDMLPAHDRVGSVELVKPSQQLYTHLLTVDRYALTDKPIPS